MSFIQWLKGLFAPKAPANPLPPPVVAPVAKPPAQPSGEVTKGVDTSHYEGSFNFAKAVADGIVFMMTKFTDGSGYDTTGAGLTAKAKAAGIKFRGGYHFFRANVSVPLQVKNYLASIAGLGLEMPAILDLEEVSPMGVSLAETKELALQWLVSAEAQTGRVPILYIDVNMTNLLGINKDPRFSKYIRWIAQYRSEAPSIPWTFWQFTDSGEQGADTDKFNGSVAELQTLCAIS